MGAETAAGACGLQFGDGEGGDAFEGDGAVVALDLAHADADLVAEEVVGAEGGHIHVAADGDELGAREVVEGEVVFEDFADFDDFFG